MSSWHCCKKKSLAFSKLKWEKIVNWDWCTCNYSISSLRQILSNMHTKQFPKMMNTLWQVFFWVFGIQRFESAAKSDMKTYHIILIHFEPLGPNTKHILFATPDFSWIFTENIQLWSFRKASLLLCGSLLCLKPPPERVGKQYLRGNINPEVSTPFCWDLRVSQKSGLPLKWKPNSNRMGVN